MKIVRYASPALLLAACASYSSTGTAATPVPTNYVDLVTNVGTIPVQLYGNNAPLTVKNFLAYVDKGFYTNTLIHRLVKDFVIQGGGYELTGKFKTTDPAIANESATAQLSNTRGTLSMARTSDPNSATSQYFINLKDNSAVLDYGTANAKDGYAVFANTSARGLAVVDSIASLQAYQASSATPFPETATGSLIYVAAAYSYAYSANQADTPIVRAFTAGTGKGSVKISPAGAICKTTGTIPTCSLTLKKGQSVTLTATPSTGSVFAGWQGDCKGAASTQTPKVPTLAPASINCIATFIPA